MVARKDEIKTKVNDASVEGFLNSAADDSTRADCFEILKLMEEATKEPAKMWGASIVGFGSYHYKGAGGREGDWMLTGFSPRKQNLTLYLMSGFEQFQDLLQKLGKHKTSMGCLYIKKLDDVDRTVLKDLIVENVKRMKEQSK
jgi:hypothetical protein